MKHRAAPSAARSTSPRRASTRRCRRCTLCSPRAGWTAWCFTAVSPENGALRSLLDMYSTWWVIFTDTYMFWWTRLLPRPRHPRRRLVRGLPGGEAGHFAQEPGPGGRDQGLGRGGAGVYGPDGRVWCGGLGGGWSERLKWAILGGICLVMAPPCWIDSSSGGSGIC